MIKAGRLEPEQTKHDPISEAHQKQPSTPTAKAQPRAVAAADRLRLLQLGLAIHNAAEAAGNYSPLPARSGQFYQGSFTASPSNEPIKSEVIIAPNLYINLVKFHLGRSC